MQNHIINDIYDRISKILKNDQQYPYRTMGRLIIDCIRDVQNIEYYYDTYPALVDVAELGASLEHEGSDYQKEIIAQIKYKLRQLHATLPDIS